MAKPWRLCNSGFESTLEGGDLRRFVLPRSLASQMVLMR
jgi:hypothetical protein